MDFLTCMWPADGSATAKRLTPQGVQPAAQHMWFSCEQVPVQDFLSLAQALTLIATASQAIFLVRGKPLPGADMARMRRAHVTDPTLESAPRQWLLLDLDSYLPEAQDFAQRPAHYAAQARADLPQCFHGAAMWWQATGGAGVKPGVRLRLGVWLDRPLSDEQVKAWIKTWTVAVDPTLYTPSQPHYMAAPILDGVPDPVSGPRCGVLEGEPQVVVPDVSDIKPLSDPLAALAATVRRIAKIPHGERNTGLNQQVYALASAHSPDELSDATIQEECSKAASEAGLTGHEIEATIRSALAAGRAKYAENRSGWRAALALDKSGNPRATAANASLYLEHHPTWAGSLAYSERDVSMIWTRQPPWGGNVPRAVHDSDTTRIVEWFQDKAWLDVKASWVRAGLEKAANLHRFDAVQDWLRGLPKWDGRDRLDTFFIRHWQVPDTALTRAQSRCWFVQAVRRAFATLAKPVKADYVVVLCGRQGLRKSSALEALCPDPRYFSDAIPSLESKDARMCTARSWIIELSEFSHRKHDRNALKAFITTQADRFRPPYGREEIVVPRRCVFIGTVNEAEFLADTGNRRFWPMTCHARADLDAVLAEREQLWSEAVARAEAGEVAYLGLDQEEQAAQVVQDYREDQPMVDTLRTALVRGQQGPLGIPCEPWQLERGRLVRATPAQLCALVGIKVTSGWEVQALNAAMTELGWRKVKHGVSGIRCWMPPEDWPWQDVAQERAN